MSLKRIFFRRLLAALLCFTMILLAAVFSVVAYEDEIIVQTIETDQEQAQENQTFIASFFSRLWNFFWNHFQLLSFMLNPSGGYIYNSRLSFQWIFGYNMVYNRFAPVIGAFIDTARIPFYYNGRNWKIMLWKGSYLFGLTSGAEIGLYTRPLSRTIEHYDCARREDWIGMAFSFYDNDHLVVTRPMETRWWQTAYAFHIASQILGGPRYSQTLIGALRFNTPGKAEAFAGSLYDRGFAGVDREIVREDDCYDRFTIDEDGQTVYFSWRSLVM